MKFAALVNGFGKLAERLTDRFWYYVLLNPVARLLLIFLIVAVHRNYELEGQLDTVCDAIEIPDDFSFDDKPKLTLRRRRIFVRPEPTTHARRLSLDATHARHTDKFLNDNNDL